MFITKKTVSNDEILKPKNQIVKSNEIKLETKGEVNNFIILREITKNINLSETLIRR
jgi:hypothetical protein